MQQFLRKKVNSKCQTALFIDTRKKEGGACPLFYSFSMLSFFRARSAAKTTK